MLDIRFIRENPDVVKNASLKKHFDCDVDKILELDSKLNTLIKEVELLRAERNRLSKQPFDKNNTESRERNIEIKSQLVKLEETQRELDKELRYLLLLVPNIPSEEVPEGETDDDNVLVRKWGTPREFDFDAKDHLELALNLGIVDFERGSKVSGSRFYYLRGNGVLLELAALRYSLDILIKNGFEPFTTPVLVKPFAMEGTGFLPRGAEEAYFVGDDDIYLVGTSEVPLVSFHSNEILDVNSLPLYYAGMSNCFRREAGAAGRDTKGLYRVHQFQKIEQIVICKNDPEESRKQHQFILSNTETILQGMGLPYRICLACGGECGIPQVYKNEVETWMPSRGKYSETHSCSTIHDFQARRLNIRYRDADGKLVFAHTLNNTAIASPRILIPILENYQQKDGSVVIPEVLRPYMGGIDVLRPR
jgi:seryl-tRNA synthetase